MEIEIIKAPFDATEVLDLIEKTFGKGERALEAAQLDGSEADCNDDVVFVAREAGVLLGTIHITVPKKNPTVSGISGFVTSEAARGKGIGSRLFAAAVEYVDTIGVETSFLGTGNPHAAKMYEKNGFRYIYGTGVMIRTRLGHECDFNDKYMDLPVGPFSISENSPALRISIVPLVVYKSSSVIYDINTDIVSSSCMTQTSCMGLFPRYMRLKEAGGAYYFAADERGTVGAVMSVKPMEDGNRVDFFYTDAFSRALPDMLACVQMKYDNIYFETAARDERKISVIKGLGYERTESGVYCYRDFEIKTLKFYK
ncbi:MAG: GNAT family N-acetyltransferase [Clostridia bacterium]|nr:GNAT family N-acetyltransferase [Clostridia bacterium]